MNTPLSLTIGILLTAILAHADGGAVLLREASGQSLVTVFMPAGQLQVGLIDTSVLVQDRKTGGAILDTTVNIAIQPRASQSPWLIFPATRAEATNKLLKAARINVPAPGLWVIRVFVLRDQEETVLTTELLVSPAEPRLTAIWPLLLIPPFAIALFGIHQALRQRPHTIVESPFEMGSGT